MYLRTIDRQLPNELGEQSRWGALHMPTRKPPGKRKYNDKGIGNDAGGTFQRDDQSNYRGVSCDEWGEEPDNENDYNGDWDNSNYQGSFFKSSKIGRRGANYATNAIEFGELMVRKPIS